MMNPVFSVIQHDGTSIAGPILVHFGFEMRPKVEVAVATLWQKEPNGPSLLDAEDDRWLPEVRARSSRNSMIHDAEEKLCIGNLVGLVLL